MSVVASDSVSNQPAIAVWKGSSASIIPTASAALSESVSRSDSSIPSRTDSPLSAAWTPTSAVSLSPARKKTVAMNAG
jgi:hypothetical protein